MDNREIFDRVKAHLLSQMKKAKALRPTANGRGEINGCCYRTSDGLKCAVGCLIPDDKYVVAMEGQGVGYVMSCVPSLFSNENYDLLNDLQMVHDAHEPSEWAEQLDRVENLHLGN